MTLVKAGYFARDTRAGRHASGGSNAIWQRGSTIGDSCIVSASSLMLGDVPDGFVAYGNRAGDAGTSDDHRARQAHQFRRENSQR